MKLEGWMKYKVKILFGFSGLMLILVIVNIFNYLITSNMETKINLLLDERFPIEQSVNATEQISGHIRVEILYALVFNKDQRREDLEEIDTSAFSFYDEIRKLEKLLPDEENQINIIKKRFQEFYTKGRELLKVDTDKKLEVYGPVFTELKTRQMLLQESIDDLYIKYSDKFKANLIDIQKQTVFLSQVSIAVLLLGLILSLILSLFYSRSLTRPIHRLIDVINNIEKGNYSTRADIHTNDEIGKLASAFNLMSKRLNCTLVNLQEEIQERKRIQEDQFQRMVRLEEQQTALIELSRSDYTIDIHESNLYREITELAVITMKINRCSIWFFDDDNSSLICKDLFDINKNSHKDDLIFLNKETIIFLEKNQKGKPLIFDTIDEFDYDSNIKEYYHKYNIKSVMYIIIKIADRIIGVLGFEKTKKIKIWEPDEIIFGGALADFIAKITINQKKLETEKELFNTKNYIKDIIDSMPNYLIGVNPQGIITEWNLAAENWMNIGSEKALGQTLVSLIPLFSDYIEKINIAIDSGIPYSTSNLLIETEGDNKYFLLIVYPLFSGYTKGAVILMSDITKRLQLEQIAVQSDKMLALGGLAAGMAHELNNPIGGMMQSAQVIHNRLLKDLPVNKKVADSIGLNLEILKKYLEKRSIPKILTNISNSGLRASKIIKNMLGFSRGGEFTLASYSIAIILEEIIEIAANDFSMYKKFDFKKIKINKDYENRLPNILCEKSQIQQVLLNLLKNGVHALEKKGHDNPEFTISIKRIEDMVQIKITDNGSGMNEITLSKIFEPFYTTKKEGKGTGLGLSISFFIITENHKGNISVESTLGVGTTFIIDLPIA